MTQVRYAVGILTGLLIVILCLGAPGPARALDFDSLLSKGTDAAKGLLNKKKTADKSKEQIERECKGTFQINDLQLQAVMKDNGMLSKAECNVELRAVNYAGAYGRPTSTLGAAYHAEGSAAKGAFEASFSFETPPSAPVATFATGSYRIPDQFTLAWATPGMFCIFASGTLNITASAGVGGMISGDFSAGLKPGENAKCPASVKGSFVVPRLKE